MAGEKVFPREIEDAIKKHPAVLLVGVVGIKDESRGEAPVAFIPVKTGGRPGKLRHRQAPRHPEILGAFTREQIAAV